MIRFNVIYNAGANIGESRGFLDVDASTSVSFKRENQQYNWAEPSTGRTVEFTVPATDTNRKLLEFADDPVEYGSTMRVRHRCQMQYPGGAMMGRLDVTKYEGGRFSCVFYYPFTEGLDKIGGMKLSDCLCTLAGVVWSSSSALDADATLPYPPVEVIKYDGSYQRYTGAARWSWMPCINAKMYIEDILDNMGVSHDLDVKSNIYLVAPTLKGADEVSGTVAKTGLTAGSIASSLQNYLEFNQSGYLVKNGVFNIPVHTSCWSIRPKADIKITFPAGFPNTYELIHVSGNKTTFLGGYYRDASGWHGEPLANRTVEFKTGQSFFIVQDLGTGYGNGYLKGWDSDVSPFSYTLTVARSGDILQGDTWKVQYNAPDMTVVEFLRSLALMEGKELYYDVERDAVMIQGADVGSSIRKALENVTSMLYLSRNVEDWGAETRKVLVRFDSEDYVTDQLTSSYDIDTEIIDGTEEKKIGWSEGSDAGEGTGNVYIEDTSFENDTPTVRAKQWTAGLSGLGKLLKRVELETYDANAKIANAGTCVKVSFLQDIADFLAVTRDASFFWRGMSYVWTSAEWSGGVTTMTLQAY